MATGSYGCNVGTISLYWHRAPEKAYGCLIPFSYDDLSKRIAQLGKFDPRIPTLLNSARLTEVLNKLYELGVIGNTGRPMNFIFLGRVRLDLLGKMVIHTPLRNYFSVQYDYTNWIIPKKGTVMIPCLSLVCKHIAQFIVGLPYSAAQLFAHWCP